jgi:phenylacetate-CoA ligase
VGLDPSRVTDASQLAALPPLDKRTVRAERERMIDVRTRGSHVHKRTSGSSGEQTHIEYDVGSEAWRQAVRVRGWGWAGYRPGERVAYYWGQPVPLEGLHGAKIRLDRALRRELYLECLVQDEETLAAAARAIARHRPHLIVGYAVALGLLARHVIDRRLRAWDDLGVVSCAEPLGAQDREVVTRAFGPVFDTYGSRETMLLAAECERHDGLHTMDDAHVVEVVVEGRPARPGEVGEVLVTDLHNYGMPLIRYRNGDLAVAGPDEPCACGRGLGRVRSIAGRVSETLHGPHGEAIPGMFVHCSFVSSAPNVREMQVVQRASGEVVLRVVPADRFDPRSLDQVEARMKRYLRGLPLRVECVEHIERGPAGKFRPVIVEPRDPTGAAPARA